jgi:hypothetical protein
MDFGRAVVHTGVERPVNGLTQLVGLPELHLVDDKQIHDSVGATLGNMVGIGFDMALLARFGAPLLGNIGGAGALGTATRFAILGGVYDGLLQPANPDSHNMLTDRVTNGLVGAATWGALGLAGAGLDRTGLFAVPEARSLAASIGYGALTGSAGGLAHAESKALFKDGQLLASPGDFAGDALSYGVMGGVFGGVGFGLNKLAGTSKYDWQGDHRSQDGESSLQVTLDRYGQPVKLTGSVPTGRYDSQPFNAVKMTDGSWWNADQAPVKINGVKFGEGSVSLASPGGQIYRFPADGRMEAYSAFEQGTKEAGATFTEQLGRHTVTANDSLVRTYDQEGRLTEIKPVTTPGNKSPIPKAAIEYNEQGALQGVDLSTPQQETVHFQRNGDSSWDVFIKNSKYSWSGDIQVTPGTATTAEQVQLVPKEGETIPFKFETGSQPISAYIKQAGKFSAGGSGQGFITVDADGKAIATGGKDFWRETIINGTKIQPGTQVEIKPGDQIKTGLDVGDRGPDIIYRDVPWTKGPDGKPLLDGVPLQPNTQWDLPSPTQSGS